MIRNANINQCFFWGLVLLPLPTRSSGVSRRPTSCFGRWPLASFSFTASMVSCCSLLTSFFTSPCFLACCFSPLTIASTINGDHDQQCSRCWCSSVHCLPLSEATVSNQRFSLPVFRSVAAFSLALDRVWSPSPSRKALVFSRRRDVVARGHRVWTTVKISRVSMVNEARKEQTKWSSFLFYPLSSSFNDAIVDDSSIEPISRFFWDDEKQLVAEHFFLGKRSLGSKFWVWKLQRFKESIFHWLVQSTNEEFLRFLVVYMHATIIFFSDCLPQQ